MIETTLVNKEEVLDILVHCTDVSDAITKVHQLPTMHIEVEGDEKKEGNRDSVDLDSLSKTIADSLKMYSSDVSKVWEAAVIQQRALQEAAKKGAIDECKRWEAKIAQWLKNIEEKTNDDKGSES